MARINQTNRQLSDSQCDLWAEAIERMYGVSFDSRQIYCQRYRGDWVVYCGSEYVATLAYTSNEPGDAYDWTSAIAHFLRGTYRMDVSNRREP